MREYMPPPVREQPPMARRTDPLSSHAAADRMQESGAAESQRRKALEAVKEYPGSTSKELAERCHLDRYMLARRLPELSRMGLIVRVERKDARELRWVARA
jgi:DNA-binding MarR family transcriptional regulator